MIREAGGGLIAITLDYRLGIFGQLLPLYATNPTENDGSLGFLAGEEVKKKGALNAGIREWFQIHAKQAFMSARGTSRPTSCFPVDTEIRAYFYAIIIYSLNYVHHTDPSLRRRSSESYNLGRVFRWVIRLRAQIVFTELKD